MSGRIMGRGSGWLRGFRTASGELGPTGRMCLPLRPRMLTHPIRRGYPAPHSSPVRLVLPGGNARSTLIGVNHE